MPTFLQPPRAGEPVSTRASSSYWVCQIAGWGAYSSSRFCAAVLYLHMDWLQALTNVALLHGMAFALSHALRAYVIRHRWTSLSRPRLALRSVAAGLFLGLPMGIVTQLTPFAAFQDPGILLPGVELTIAPGIILWLNVVNWTATFILWLALYFGLLAVRRHKSAELRQSELTRALQLAELRLLKAQLNPHFLFNALNTVRALIAEDPPKAQDAVTRLASTLRHTLTCGQQELATLDHEMEIVEDHLRLESLRLEDRLEVERRISPEARGVLIPVMLLQTLVENGIKHGIAALPQGGRLSIDAEVRDGTLLLEVSNPRPSSASQGDGQGIGLHNAAERLRLLFGSRASLNVDLTQPAMASVRVRIPVASP